MDSIAEQLIARLQADPQDSASYEALKAHYRHDGDLASLANLLEGWAGANLNDWQNASQAYAEAGDLVLRSTGDRPRAKRLFRHAVQLDAGHAEASTRLQALFEEQGEYKELADFLDSYARALEAAGGARAELAALHRRLGELWERQFQRSDVAVAYFERATELEAAKDGAPPAAGDPQALAERCERDLAHETDPERKALLLTQLAELRAQQLGDLSGGIQALRQALAAMPGDVTIMHQLAGYLLARAQSVETQAARTDYRRAAELFYQIAQAVDEEHASPYLESALAAMPDHDGALAMLERLAPTHGLSELLPQYWVGYVANAGEGPELDLRRLALGQAYLQAGQLDDAIFCLQPAAEHGNDRAHELLQDAYGRQGRAGQQQPVDVEVADAAEPALPPAARPDSRRAEEEVRSSPEVIALRKRVHDALAARRHDEAAEHCRKLLELEPSDPEAFNLLESHFRKRRDYPNLRDLLLASTRVPGLPVDTRKLRLREVATLSETKLRDADAAIAAWRGVVTFDPFDREAAASLKRLLKKGQQWDELAAVLEREAVATTDVDEKAELIRDIALIHRDKRKDPAETAEAFRQLHALRPDDTAVRDELCQLLISLEAWPDAAPLIKEQIESSQDEIERLRLIGLLASVLHEKLSDYEGAYEACEQTLKLRPNDRATFDRMERIDEAALNFERLLRTLERRAGLAGKAERPGLFIRMGIIAEERLHDLDKAAEYFGDALDLVPDDQDALQRLSQMFERAGRYDQLVELLRERAVLEKEPRNRAPFYRRIAETLAEHLKDEEAAAEAYRKLLELHEDEAALRFLRGFALRMDDPQELSEALRRLAALVSDKNERRDLMFDQAVLLHERLARPAEAAVALKRIVDDIDPQFEPAIELLATVAEATDDNTALALALERRLSLRPDAAARVPLAKRLAELYEQEPRDETRAISALQHWARDEPQEPEPRRRLRKLLEAKERWPELLHALDALSEWEQDFDARDEATIAAAKVAHAHLRDAEGAFGRLLPLVEQRNEPAEQALREVALSSGMQRQLAALYVKLAQETEDPAVQALYWKKAAQVFEQELAEPAQAFEASLRMLATDLGNRDFLAQVDRLAMSTSAWKRLAQVYERLLKQTEDDDDKVALLRRHADLLENDQPEEALDRILRACSLHPHDDQLLARAEDLAQKTQRSEELLVVYDRRRAKSDDEADKLRLLLRSARLCDGPLRDRDRANQYLRSALVLAGESEQLVLEVESVARELDEARPELGADGARRTLVRSYREVAERAEADVATRLLLRSAELLRVELDDERSAFDVLRQALSLLPKSDAVFAALVESAERLKRMDAVDAHIAKLIDEAIDPSTAITLLKRRGELLEGPLNRSQDAAAVYAKLLQLRPDDGEAAEKLRDSLRRAGRYQDLLLALNKQLQRTRERDQRLPLLKEIAQSWERDLKNRWESIDAWKAVLREDSADADAQAALQRLERGRPSAPPDLLTEEAQPYAAEEQAQAASEPPAEPAVAEASSDAAAAAPSFDTLQPAAPEAPAEPAPPKKRKRKRKQTDAEAAPDDTALPPSEAPPPEESSVMPPAEESTASGELAAALAPVEQTTAEVEPSPVAPAPEAWSADPALAGEAQAVLAPPNPATSAPQQPVEDDASALAALDAGLSAGSHPLEEVDVFEDLDSVAVDVQIDHPSAQPSSTRSSSPPPLPARGSRPVPLMPPPPQPPGRSSSVPPVPPVSRTAPPPPIPSLSNAPRSHSSLPPPPLPSARPSSTPPPLPSQRSSKPPPLPQRKQD